MRKSVLLEVGLAAGSLVRADRQIPISDEAALYPDACPDYSSYSYARHTPYSKGKYELAYMRPHPACRRFNLSEVEDTIQSMKKTIRDPDLFRLFENCFPNTLDTAITWRGFSNETGEKDEEVTKPSEYLDGPFVNVSWLTCVFS